jgi:hypothetical protein
VPVLTIRHVQLRNQRFIARNHTVLDRDIHLAARRSTLVGSRSDRLARSLRIHSS